MDGPSGADPGGIAGLVTFLREHGAAIEADLQHHYGERLTDMPLGRLSWRRLRVLIDALPRTSALARELHGEFAEWSTADHLLAIAVDALQVANWQRSKDGTTGRNRPRPIPRPGVRGPRVGNPKGRTPAEVRAYLAQFKPKVEEVADGGV